MKSQVNKLRALNKLQPHISFFHWTYSFNIKQSAMLSPTKEWRKYNANRKCLPIKCHTSYLKIQRCEIWWYVID